MLIQNILAIFSELIKDLTKGKLIWASGSAYNVCYRWMSKL